MSAAIRTVTDDYISKLLVLNAHSAAALDARVPLYFYIRIVPTLWQNKIIKRTARREGIEK